MKRRAFLHGLAALPLAAAAALSAWLAGCAGDTTTSATTTSSCDGALPTSMNLHFHATCVPQSVLGAPAATNPVDMLRTGKGHSHTLDLTAAQVTDIANGVPVKALSSVSLGHVHQVQFN